MRYAGLQTLKWGIIHPWLEILPSKWWTPAMLSQNLDAIALTLIRKALDVNNGSAFRPWSESYARKWWIARGIWNVVKLGS